MTTTPPEQSPAAPTWQSLGPEQRRVLGVLIEKAKTTPAGYPMTINAVMLGCNQKNNREPLMTLDADEVERVLEELRVIGCVVEAPESTRTTKFRHRGYEWLGVERAELAVMAELLLRGAQTLGELRGRAARMEPLPDMAALKPVVEGLVGRGLMIELTTPGRGQVVDHNLYTPPELAALQARFSGHDAGDTRPPEPGPAPVAAPAGAAADALTRLAGEVASLRAEVARLGERVAALEPRADEAAE